MFGDERSLPSEKYAFTCLGITPNIVRTESELMQEFSDNVKIPECIFKYENEYASCEVKRIIGNTLPQTSAYNIRRRCKRGDFITWPWKTTIKSALDKADSTVMKKYNVQYHFIIIVVPETLSLKSRKRLENHAFHSAKELMQTENYCVRRIFLQILPGPVDLFDRM